MERRSRPTYFIARNELGMGRIERQRELARRRTRKVKVKKLRERFAKTSDNAAREAIVAKMRKISPLVDLEAEAKAAAAAAKG